MSTFEEIQQYALQFKQEQVKEKEKVKLEKVSLAKLEFVPPHERSAKIAGLFQKACDVTHQPRETFSQLVDLFYFTLTRDEDSYMKLVKQLNKEVLTLGPMIFGELMQGLYVEQDIRDYLGESYVALNLQNAGLGQAFTPWSVSRVHAEMLNPDIKAEYEEAKKKGEKISVIDPCVGTGNFLLAHKEVVIKELGLEALAQYQYYGQDVDALLVKCAQVQMLLTDYRRMQDLLIVTAYEMKEKLSAKFPQLSNQKAE